MSCQGHTLGGKFEEIRDIIDLVKDKTRVGVCIDTCHAFAAGEHKYISITNFVRCNFANAVSRRRKLIGSVKCVHLYDTIWCSGQITQYQLVVADI